MPSLYLDTCEKLIVGLIDSQLEFFDIYEDDVKKSATKIHGVLFDLFKKHNLEPKDIEQIFLASGPGSYTGIRLSEGITQVFDWLNHKSFSFYHFKVPQILGVKEGKWFSSAFKGEYFLYEWEGDSYKDSLIEEAEFKREDNFYTHFSNDHQSTHKLILENSKLFFTYLIKNNCRSKPFYYRPLDKEFKKPKI